ncbi:riboflavin synthase subunit alpha [Desulfuribacillus stibiiarsenatis]|uniref:Riboflavin synthase n=1 Tax=Desulfuribacillus stibiiarsenatis TaxID=1390249 RepID=A0A1E5L6C4_9FIRM|nr:riboflavin synthase [Desulfuribacillus stibiiarsenatis]OEH85712.1 riboflavin synthase subunit alpha [Desulfuribacillus stibiiarsenatis]
MFTGIIEEIGYIQSIQNAQGLGRRVTIQAKEILRDVNLGDSIAVNGICLTVTQYNQQQFSVDVMPETMEHTNLGLLKANSPVNLERAMQAGGRFGGHIVSGHVDGVATLAERKTLANAIILTFQTLENMLRYMIPKGSITIDGISLTIIEVTHQSFSVSIIPHTKDITTLGKKKVGDIVNIECDMIAKYVERLVSFKEPKESKKIDMDYLAKMGMI